MRLQRLFVHRLVRVLQIIVPVFLAVLVAIPAWNYWTRQQDQSAPPVRVEPLPDELAALTEGFTFTRTEGGRPRFSITARMNLGFKDNRHMLEDVDVRVFAEQDGQPGSRIRSRRCDYEKDSGDIRFAGSVDALVDGQTTIQTEELTYNHSERFVQSEKPVRVEYEGTAEGTADRLKYWIRDGVLHLDGSVHAVTSDGMKLDSGFAVFNRKENWLTVAEGIVLSNSEGSVRGADGRVEFDPVTLRPRTFAVSGTVVGEARSGSEGYHLRADWVRASLSPDGHVETVVSRGNSEFEKRAGGGRQRLTAADLDAALGPGGQIRVLDARGSATMGLGPDQILRAPWIRADGVESVLTYGESTLQAAASSIEGSDFSIRQGAIIQFGTGSSAILRTEGRLTEADRTEARIDSSSNRLIELLQTGNVRFREGGRSGSAASVRIDEAGAVVLDGSAVVVDTGRRLEASRVLLHQQDGSFLATGNVKTTSTANGDPLLVTADRAEGAGEKLNYTGNVQLWRGSSRGLSRESGRIRANRLEAQGSGKNLRAEGAVETSFEGVAASADSLSYDESGGIAHYLGTVRAETRDAVIAADDVRVTLIDRAARRIAATGSVVIHHQDRLGAGDALDYDAQTREAILSGNAAQVEDSLGHTVNGQKLTWNLKDERITVNAAPGAQTTSKGKAR